MKMASRLNLIKPSVTLTISEKAKQMSRQGLPVISMSMGEPDFDTPKSVVEAGCKALRDGKTRYTAVAGILPLREAIVDKLKRDQGLEYAPNQIVVATGAKQALFNAMGALINEGDEAVMVAPYWLSYYDIALLWGGTPRVVQTSIEDGLKVQPEALKAALNAKTKLIALNIPSNPAGITYTKEELMALADVLRAYPDVWILLDDIYEYILWDQKFYNLLEVAPDLYNRTIVINGVSKAYSMTGWRIGYAAGPEAVIKGMRKLQSQSTSHATTMAQYASITALQILPKDLQDQIDAYKERRDFFDSFINSYDFMQAAPSQATFYTFVDVKPMLQKLGIDDVQLAEKILEEAYVSPVPGMAFGAPGFLRFSCALALEDIKKATQQLDDFFKKCGLK